MKKPLLIGVAADMSLTDCDLHFMNLNQTRTILDLLNAAEQMSARRDRGDLFRELCVWVRVALGANATLLYSVRPAIEGHDLIPVGWSIHDEQGGMWRDNHTDGMLPADPFLATAIDSKAPWYRGSGPHADRVVLPVSNGERISWLLEIRTLVSPPTRILQALVTLVRTFEHLIANWEYANLDTLTGLLNRKTFDDQFERLLMLAERQRNTSSERRKAETKHPCYLAIADIDHFKQINDNFGHLFGDEVLIRLADCMRKAFRSDDTLFRFGGEEFVIMLRHVPEDAVESIFERFRKTVEDYDFPQVGRVTCSVGIAFVDDRLTPAELIGRADEALYYAKGHGRNRVCSFDQLVMTGELKLVPKSTAQEDADIFF